MKESDWKLLRSKFPLWVERYMEKVCEEYKQILKSDASACEKYKPFMTGCPELDSSRQEYAEDRGTGCL